jgi:phosphoadenosine phosphosulfate reductase
MEKRPCGKCGGRPRAVALTPPGDARPAFSFDIQLVRRVAFEQFGSGAGDRLLRDGEFVMLNRIPDIDRSDEVIAGGEVVANLTYILGKGFVLQLRMAGALRIGVPEKGWVVADEGAIPSLLGSSNLLGPGVVACSPGIRPLDEVIVLRELAPGKETVECQSGAPQYERVYVLKNEPPRREVIATGSARMGSEDMLAKGHGTGVKVRWRMAPKIEGGNAPRDDAVQLAEAQGSSPPPAEVKRPENVQITYDDLLAANKDSLKEAVARSVTFVQEGVKQIGKQVAVSYSGGKDSLATLLLVLDAGIRPKVLFIDTGLEFPETVENATSVSRELGLELSTEEAGEAFWLNLARFGPPARDGRWCCKCCKLGPVTRHISKHFPDGVLSFIGQRRYESEARASKGSVWKNPWVPGQVGASPIQEWTAFAVWLYLFSKMLDIRKDGKNVAWNPWYERGLDRIGCFLCPATNLGDFELVKKGFAGYDRWERELAKLPENWRVFGLWRWKHLPKGMQDLLAQRNVVPEPAPAYPGRLELRLSPIVPIDSGISIGKFAAEGKFSRALDIALLQNRLLPLGKVERKTDLLTIAHHTEIKADGAVVVRGETEDEVKRRVAALKEAVLRSEECAGCGICAGRCKSDAADIKNGRMAIDATKCTSCGACLAGPCPVTTYPPDGGGDV